MNFSVAFVRELAYGLCVGVRIPDSKEDIASDVLGRLDPEEARHAASLHTLRRPTWVAGRLALREALRRLGAPAAPIWANDRGAPITPAGLVGSISHKRTLAVALAAQDTGWAIGVDVEQRFMGDQDISRHVLTASEIAATAGLTPEQRSGDVMVRFSLKESIYKAIDPFLRRFVGFQEVSVTPLRDGTVTVHTHLKSGIPLEVHARWTQSEALPMSDESFVLTCAQARPADYPT